MGNGQFVMERGATEEDFFQNPRLVQAWYWCWERANYQTTQVTFGGKVIDLQPGQFVTGRLKMSLALGCPPSTAWEQLLKLERLAKIEVKSDNKKSIITVIGWESAQSFSKKPQQQIRQPADNQPTQVTKVTKVTKISCPRSSTPGLGQKLPKAEPSPEAKRLANLLLVLIKQRRPTIKLPNRAVWEADMDKLIRIDKRNHKEAEAVLRWSQQDGFWQNNILSPATLRKQYDQLALKMQAPPPNCRPSGQNIPTLN